MKNLNESITRKITTITIVICTFFSLSSFSQTYTVYPGRKIDNWVYIGSTEGVNVYYRVNTLVGIYEVHWKLNNTNAYPICLSSTVTWRGAGGESESYTTAAKCINCTCDDDAVLVKPGANADDGWGGVFGRPASFASKTTMVQLSINSIKKDTYEENILKEKQVENKKEEQVKEKENNRLAREAAATKEQENKDRIDSERKDAKEKQQAQNERTATETAAGAATVAGAIGVFTMDNNSNSNKYRGPSYKFALPFELNFTSIPVNETTDMYNIGYDQTFTDVQTSSELMPIGPYIQPEFYPINSKVFSVGGYCGLGLSWMPGRSDMSNIKYGLKSFFGLPFLQYTFDFGHESRSGSVDYYNYNEYADIETTCYATFSTEHDYLKNGIRIIIDKKSSNSDEYKPLYIDFNISEEKFLDAINSTSISVNIYSLSIAKSNGMYYKLSYADHYPAASLGYSSQTEFEYETNTHSYFSFAIGKNFEWFGKSYSGK